MQKILLGVDGSIDLVGSLLRTGESWAYVTIALVGMENCPHHHSHAIELERICKFNPHVGFFDVHGRVCERLTVQDLLSSV